MPVTEKRELVGCRQSSLSVSRRCELLGLRRSSFYYQAVTESALNLELMNKIDEIYTDFPFYGSRRILDELRQVHNYEINRKRVQRLMRLMGVEAIYPKPRTTKEHSGHKKYPYLLDQITVLRPNQVWCSDITYIRMHRGFLYLVAVMDWFSRYVLSWKLSNSLENSFCIEALEEALELGCPEIFNTDQGSQFTSEDYTRVLSSRDIHISMDGRGRALDNVFIERLWRSVKYEDVYLRDYQNGREAHQSLERYWDFYNYRRRHQSLDRTTPAHVHYQLN